MSQYMWDSQRQPGRVPEPEADDDGESSGGEEEEEEGFRGGGKELDEDFKEVLFFVIDCASDSMFEPIPSSGDVPAAMALRCFAGVVESKMLKSPSDLVSLVFYGTVKESSGALPGIYERYPLQMPDSEVVHEVLTLAEEIEAGNMSAFKMGHGNKEASLADLFLTLKRSFSPVAKNTIRRAMLMTNNDEPVIDPTMLAAIRTHARDLESSDKATLDLFPINRDENKQFDVSKFWQEVMFRDPRGEDEVVVEGASNTLDDLMSKVKRKTDRKRSYMRIPFEIAKGVTIGIRGYNLVVEQKKPGHLYLKSTNDEVVKSKQVLQCRDTAVPLAPQEIKSAYFYGGERVLFSKDEIATMRNFGPPGLTLLGFKPKSALKVHHTIKNSTFIYPDEAEYRGSTAIFATLLRRMAALDKVAICKLIPRKHSAPRLAALWPEKELTGEEAEGAPKLTGFHLIPLPFADDIRHIPASTDLRAPTEVVENARNMVKSVRLKGYNPEEFKNPALTLFQNTLAAIALNRDAPEPLEDETLPQIEHLVKKTANAAKDLEENVEEVLESMNPGEVKSLAAAAAAKKRPLPDGDEEGPRKRGGGSDKPVTVDDIEIFAKADRLERATIPLLTEYLKANGLKARGKKDDLIAAVKKHLDL